MIKTVNAFRRTVSSKTSRQGRSEEVLSATSGLRPRQIAFVGWAITNSHCAQCEYGRAPFRSVGLESERFGEYAVRCFRCEVNWIRLRYTLFIIID